MREKYLNINRQIQVNIVLALKVRLIKCCINRALREKDLQEKDAACHRALRFLVLLREEVQRVRELKPRKEIEKWRPI